MTWLGFLCLPSRLTNGLLWIPRTPNQLWCLIPNMSVQYQSSSIITCNESSREITGSYNALTGHPASSQRGIILVKSTQIRWFTRRPGEGGWSGRAIAQQRPRVSKLGLKGLSDYHSNDMAVEAARREASGPNKKGYSHETSTQKRELDNSSKPKQIKGNRQPAKKNPHG